MGEGSCVVGEAEELADRLRSLGQRGRCVTTMRLFLEKAHKVSQEWGNLPIVLGGDLNCTPQSAMYQFVASSELDVRLHSRRDISGPMCPEKCPTLQYRNRDAARPLLHPWSDEELRLATGSEGVTQLRHPLKLGSSYPGVPGSYRTRDILGEPLATSYHSRFLGTVDYIWHTEELVPVRVLETLPIEVLRKTGGLPSKKWGSDHLALACELAFADTVMGSDVAAAAGLAGTVVTDGRRW
ncbi:hypothetical protein RJ640_025062 [Escallonia rubra]|uniref:Endonuclease/exonuclease/phosphatase domain-containing protein n=1 Tax=Escallonia rubra TaxID=112253 RepID=A0AA88QND4_9ASTE|nr:hypothetical protein RJ640_025062 [Escallonia rubra]